jgi:two-component system cell cycle sensor histidine kinase/response regulator CckA
MRKLGPQLDLLVTDVMMPRMKGTELARWLLDRSPDVPLLFVSGYADGEVLQEWVDANPDGFLSKPFEPSELLERVRRLIGPALPA